MESLRGKLLVASPALVDPNFSHAVILVGDHNEDGAMGLVLNRPSLTTVSEAVPMLERLADPEAPVYVGGPVQPSVIMVLARFVDPDAGLPVAGGIAFLPGGADLDALETQAQEARVFAGYAGWGPGQLEAEIERADWVVGQPEESRIFAAEPEQLWGEVLEDMGSRFALLARMPPDPSLN